MVFPTHIILERRLEHKPNLRSIDFAMYGSNNKPRDEREYKQNELDFENNYQRRSN